MHSVNNLDYIINRLSEHTDRDVSLIISDFGRWLYLANIDYIMKPKDNTKKFLYSYRRCLEEYQRLK